MKRVLVVDDEADMLWMLQRNLNKDMQDVEVLAADSGEEALALLSDRDIHLVITDINMPGMNGLDLLVEINNRYPKTGVIIMTAYPSNAYESKAMLSGSLKFIEKPFDIKDMRKIVEDIFSAESGFQGVINGIDLVDIVQFNGMSQATAALKVSSSKGHGMIFFKNGQVVHAITDDTSGESAFFTILDFHGGSLQNIKGVEPPQITISKSLESLLLEAARKNDESSPAHPAYHSGSSDTDEDDDPGPLTADTGTASSPDTSDAATSQPPGTAQRQQFIGEKNISAIQAVLAEFTAIDGVHTACLVGRDGFLLDSLARSGIDAEMIGAIASSGFGSAESMGEQLGQGELKLSMFEYHNGPVMFAPVGLDAFLVIVADNDTNLGWIRIAIRKNSKIIQEMTAM